MTIEDRYCRVKENIEKICSQCGRNSEDVKVVAVTKTRSADEINRIIKAGAKIVGENRVQEFLEKYDFIDKNVDFHLIGQLQTNKVKYICDKVSLIHSVDRISLANEIEKFCIKNNLEEKKVLVEVNIGCEETKSGILPDNLAEFLDILKNFRYIKPIGLMTVAPATATEAEQHEYFDRMQRFLELGKESFGQEFCELSMGMSRDYETAIKHGSTMVRLGTILFGERNYK